jgi:UDP-N-acetylmuramoyl-tripeptide--D-alanyl-D-alanine ligase
LSFGLNDSADVRATQIEADAGSAHFTLHLLDTAIELTLPLAGIHNVLNACAAAAVATALDVAPQDIKVALESLQPVAGRLQPLQGQNGSTLFDDSYNANPLSVVAAAEFLASLPGKGWFVLGDMFELGDDADVMHRDVGEAIRNSGVERLLALGDLSREAVAAFGEGGSSFTAIEDLIAELQAEVSDDVNLLIKGSRGMRMERVVEALRIQAPLRKAN